MKTWGDSEITLLKDVYNKKTNAELMDLFPGKSACAIYKKAYKLGLRKSADIEYKNRSEANRRERCNWWKGGVRMTKAGYRQILMPEHPRADPSGYVMEHIAVFEKETGIQVPKHCCIHHLNGNKSDNRISNLCLMSRGGHIAFHNEI
ncbi:MAG: HNH endonuclease, partial [Oscillospiraceae bacterium]|nr:HNH endonuclease [Oscillospiraceae bacterium]